MASGKHIGKVVVAFPEAFRAAARRTARAGDSQIKPDGCYLITGAFGGFGKVLARVAGEMRRAASRAQQPQRRGDAGSRKPSSQSLQDRGVEVRVVPRGRRFAERCYATARGNPRRADNRCAASFISRW